MKREVWGVVLLAVALGSVAYWQWGGARVASPFETQEASLTEQELLGKRLFEDVELSDPAGVACASCHEPGKAFQGNHGSPIAALAQGSRKGHFGTRNTPSLTYAAFAPAFHFAIETNEHGEVEHLPTGGQFLDGRAADLVAQVEGPLLHPDEMNNASKAAVVAKVRASAYASLMKKVAGESVFEDEAQAFDQIAMAIAAYERTAAFAPFASKFDAVLRGKASFTPLEAKGFELFKDPEKGNCIACHVGDETSRKPEDWLFTDYTYDTFGAPRNAKIAAQHPDATPDLGLCEQQGIHDHLPKGMELESLCGAFKVPTLRNVALTAPYLHHGVFESLREVVDFYATRDTHPERWYPRKADGSVALFDDLPSRYHGNVNVSEAPYDRKLGEKPRLNEAEIDAIVAFLQTLTDSAQWQ